MKKKMKWLSIMLCFVMITAMAAGCGATDSGDARQIVTNGGTETSNGGSETPDGGTEEANSETGATDNGESGNTDNQIPEPASASNATVTIEEQVLVEQEGIVITAMEYVTDSIWGDGIKLLLENNSDTDVTFSCNALIVNDYMITDLFISEVTAGHKANDILYLSNTQLTEAGIENVGKVEIYFRVFDSNTYVTIFDAECATIQTSEYANMDTTPNDAGAELYNEGGIRIVGKTVDENSFWGTAILLYCENNSGQNVSISVEDMAINGFMMTPFFTTTIYDGKKSIDTITIFSSDLEENGIESIEEVELKFHIYNADTYSTIADSESITFSAQ